MDANDQDGQVAQQDETRERVRSSRASSPQELTRSGFPISVTPQRVHGSLATLATLSTLGFFSFLGLLIRLGLSWLGSFNGQPVFALIWAQLVGCALMGAFSTRKSEIERLYLPLYTGLTTGLCGSITTFSSWMSGTFMGFSQVDRPPHGGFFNFMDGLGWTIITLGGSIAAFVFGTHMAPVLLPKNLLHAITRHSVQEKTAHVSDSEEKLQQSRSFMPQYSAVLHILVISVYLLCWVGVAFIAAYVPAWRGIVMFGLLFAPFGTWTRFYLSRLNPHFVNFPLGTFLANQTGTAILAACLALQRSGNRTHLQCQVLQGFDDGLCGCLSTVSTFIAEIRKLDRRKSHAYAIASWVAGQLLMLVILGSVDFVKGGLGPICSL